MKRLSAYAAKGALVMLLLSNPRYGSSKPLHQRRRGQEVGPKAEKEYPVFKDYPVYKHDSDVPNVPPPKKDIVDPVEYSDTDGPDRLRIDESELYEVATTYEGGWVQDGIMFDVRVNNDNATSPNDEGIVVLGLDILTPVAYETLCVEIYSRDGSYSGFDTVQSAWNFLGSVSVMGLGKDTPTIIPLGSFDPVYVGPDSTRSFYVTTQDESLRYTAYTNGEHTSGSVFSSSTEDGANVEVLVGVAKNYPFAQSWPDRVFNGAIRYALGDNVDLSTILDEDQAALATAAMRGKFTCDVDPSVTNAPNASSSTTASSVAASLTTVSSVVASLTTPSPVVVSTSTDAPVAAVTSQPSEALSDAPTFFPTTLEFTLKKLATTLHGGLKQAGMMFDIRVPSVEEGGPAEGVTVLTFEVSTFLTDEICVEVYSMDGTHVGYETDVVEGEDGSWSSPTWASLGAATATGMGEEVPTHLPVGALDPTFIGPGETRAYYVTMTVPEMRYTEPAYKEKTGDVFVESSMGHMQILVGTAVSYPFGDTWKDRIFNGAIIFAVGEVEDGKYSDVLANERSRSCSVSTGFPVASPSVETGSPVAQTDPTHTTVTTPEDETITTTQSAVSESEDETITATQSTLATSEDETITTTTDATDGRDPIDQGDESDEESTTSSTSPASSFGASRFDDTCPSASLKDTSASKEVVVEYKYAMITNSSNNFDEYVSGFEDVMHTELIESKCSATSGTRRMQDSITYYRFNSNPSDEIVSGEACTGVSLAPYEECKVVQGGFTAYVPDSVDESSVQDDLGAFADDVLSDTKNYDALGVNGVIVESDAHSSRGNVDSANAEDQSQDGSNSEYKPTLSVTTSIILAAVAGCVALALILLFLKGRNKRNKRATANEEMFHEFDEDPTDLGPDYGAYNKKSADPRLFRRADEESTLGNAPMILNEHDEMSLISNDFSKSRFAVPPPASPGSDASRSSKGSVKFVRAGESFTSRSHQPEDTVDL